MQLKTRIILCVTALISIILLFSAVTVVKVLQESHNHKKAQLVHNQLFQLKRLQNRTIDTFSRVRREFLDKDQTELTFDFLKAVVEIRKTITHLEQNATEEAAFHISNPFHIWYWPESQSMQDILSEVAEQVLKSEKWMGTSQAAEAGVSIQSLIDKRIEGQFLPLLQQAISSSYLAQEKAYDEISSSNEQLVMVSAIAALLGVVLAAFSVRFLLFRLHAGIREMEKGSIEFEKGNLTYQIDLPGRDELSKLATRFNRMSVEIARRQRVQKDVNKLLELRVAQRTRELSLANDKLKKKDETRRQFFAEVSHELRTPVTAIKGEAEVTLMDLDASREEMRLALQSIVDVSGNLSRLIADLFLIAREQAGVHDLKKEQVDLVVCLENTVKYMTHLVSKHGGSIGFETKCSEALIEGDSQRIEQMLQVFISNSLQYAGPRCHISLEVSDRDSEWLMTVTDDGPGIEPKDAELIFQRYKSMSTASKIHTQEQSSTGLGLAIARSITSSHNGRVWADTSHKGGARFCIALPKATDQQCDHKESALELT